MKKIFRRGTILIAAVLLYPMMIMPRMRNRSGKVFSTQKFFAHRGLHDNASDAPENSMTAFARAADAGYGIELDIQLSKDRIPVVFHDDTLKRVCGVEGKVGDYTCEELQKWMLCGSEERIPRLEEVLRLVAGRVPLIIEFKLPRANISLCSAADALLEKYEGPYCMESFNPLGLLWYRIHRPDVCRGQLADAFLREGERRGILYFLLQNLLLNFVGKPDFVAYHNKYPRILSRRICRGIFRSTAAAWTIRSREELAEAKKYFDVFIFEGFLPGEGPDKI